MDGIPGSATAPPREALRLLPLLAIFELSALAACIGYASLAGSGGLIAAAPDLRALWQVSALGLAACASVLFVLFGTDTLRAARGGALRLPSLALVLVALGLILFGFVGILAGQEESYGRAPHGIGSAFGAAYIAAALFLFGLAFVGYRWTPRPVDRWAVVLAAAHGLMATGWGFALAYVAVTPPSWVT